MIVCRRIEDGSIFPYSPKTAGKAGFETVDEPDIKPCDNGKPLRAKRPLLKRGSAMDALEREFADWDDNAINGYLLEEFGVEFPPEARREDMLKIIRERRAVGAVMANANMPSNTPTGDVPEPPAADVPPVVNPPVVDAAPNGDAYKGMSKPKLAELALAKYGYAMEDSLDRNQMIAQLNLLEQEARGK